jgi:hypothetical protein
MCLPRPQQPSSRDEGLLLFGSSRIVRPTF